MLGRRGGSGGRDGSKGDSGASGAYIEAVFKLDQLNLFPGDKLTLIAGGGGQRGTSDTSAADSGGAGGVGSASYGYAGGIGGAAGPAGESGGGGGGGAAAAMLLPNGNILVLAGGGAGGNGEQGGNSGSTPAYGGGVYVAQNGVSTNGAAGQRPSGDGGGTGGGGGGGPGGGTGSAVNEPSQTNPSSGGRSDYTLLQSYNIYSVAGNAGNSTETTVAAPNNSDIDYFSGVGTGGKGSSQRISNESGGDGLVLLYVGA